MAIKKLGEFTLVNGEVKGSSKPDNEGRSNYWNFESYSSKGRKIGYGSFATEIPEAEGFSEKMEKGCLVKIKIEVFEKPEGFKSTTKGEY